MWLVLIGVVDRSLRFPEVLGERAFFLATDA